MYETFTVIIGIVVALVAGVAAGRRTLAKTHKWTINQLEHRVANDHNQYFMVLRRELANYVIRREPGKFLESYRKNHDELKRYKTFSRVALTGEYIALCERFKYLRDLDIVQSEIQSYVLYEDAFGWKSIDDVLAHYWTICRFQRLKTLLDEHWAGFDVTSNEDLAHCEEYVTAINDAKFVIRLEKAIRTYYASRTEVLTEFENDEVFVRPLHHFAALRYGVGFKDTNEFGIRSVFQFDEADKAPSITYYRSDSSFTKEDYVDTRLKDYFR
jgi:hypothetical protein